jgi:ABC-type glycerol-3-phosphate transport system substrate-binding protein
MNISYEKLRSGFSYKAQALRYYAGGEKMFHKGNFGFYTMAKREKIVKRLCLALFCILLMISTAACGKDEAQNTVNIGIDGYVYVPKYRELSYSQNAYLGNFNMSKEGDALYYLKVDYSGAAGITSQVYSVSLTEESEPTPTSLTLSNNYNPIQMVMDQDGNFIFVVQSYNEDNTVVTYALEKFDINGNLLTSIDVSEQLNEDPENSYIQYMAIDGEGNYYICGGQVVWLYSGTGEYRGKIEFGNYCNSMGTGKDGKVYVLYYGEGDLEMADIDFAGKKMGQVYKSIPNLNGGNLAAGVNGDFLFNDGSGLLEYDLATQTYKKILDWVDSDVSGDSVLLYSALPDGRILVINSTWESESNLTELVYLTKTSVSEMPEREIIQAGSLYDSYLLRDVAIKFNKSNDKYRISLKSYIDNNVDWTETTQEDAIAVMTNEISANKAPDILLLSSGTVDISAYAAKGVIADLGDFLDKDEDIKREDLLESVIKAFTYNDKLIGLPGSFTIQTIVGKSSVVGDQPGMTIDKLSGIMDQYPDIPVFPYATKNDMMQVLLAFSLDQFIDWDKAKCYFNDEAFLKLLELCNRFPAEANYDVNYDGYGGAISQGSVLMENAYIYDLSSYQIYKNRANEPITFVGYPTPDGSSGGAIQASEGIYTINGKSKNKEGAWEFIKFAIQESNRNMGDFPVLKSRLDEVIAEAMTAEYEMDENGQPLLDENGNKIERSKGGIGFENGDMIEIYASTQEEVDGFMALLDSAGINYGGSMEILAIISEESQGYFEGQKSVSEVADVIQSRVQIYVSENS